MTLAALEKEAKEVCLEDFHKELCGEEETLKEGGGEQDNSLLPSLNDRPAKEEPGAGGPSKSTNGGKCKKKPKCPDAGKKKKEKKKTEEEEERRRRR